VEEKIMITTLIALLSSGAGGGLLGGIFGLFKQSQERKERVEMAHIELDRDTAEYANDQAERDHTLLVLEKSGRLEIEKVATESEAAMEISNQDARGAAVISEFKNLNTSGGLDNFRASIRPLIAVWAVSLFSYMLVWAFSKYSAGLSAVEGKEILLNLFATLSFTITSVVTFYYVSRRNSAPTI
jgi:hypothetical protein